MNFRFNQTHLTELKKCSDVTNNAWVGHDPIRWAQDVTRSAEPNGLLDELQRISQRSLDEGRKGRLNRSDLFDLCGESTVSPEACFLAIMAWGGQKRDHGRIAWAKRGKCLQVISLLRSGQITRHQSYSAFKNLRDDDQLPGIGPAYFTKLIYFADPKHDGYIMDQWTSLSMNLLVEGTPIVDLYTQSRFDHRRRRDTVTDKNGPDAYDRFCQAIEDLATQLGSSPGDAEEIIFSIGAQGRRPPGPWRQYVKENRP